MLAIIQHSSGYRKVAEAWMIKIILEVDFSSRVHEMIFNESTTKIRITFNHDTFDKLDTINSSENKVESLPVHFKHIFQGLYNFPRNIDLRCDWRTLLIRYVYRSGLIHWHRKWINISHNRKLWNDHTNTNNNKTVSPKLNCYAL